MLHLDTCAQCQFTMLQSSKNRDMSSRTHSDAQIVVVLDRTARSRRNVPSTSSDAGAYGRVCVRAAAASSGRAGIAAGIAASSAAAAAAAATIGAPVVAPRAVDRPAALRLSAYGITRRAATG